MVVTILFTRFEVIVEYSRQRTEFGIPMEDPEQQSVSNIFRIGDRRGKQK